MSNVFLLFKRDETYFYTLSLVIAKSVLAAPVARESDVGSGCVICTEPSGGNIGKLYFSDSTAYAFVISSLYRFMRVTAECSCAFLTFCLSLA